MKMVIRGAQAPKCDKRPVNPTSTTAVGTMSGSGAGGKLRGVSNKDQGAARKSVSSFHQPQYQGLLQAPRVDITSDRLVQGDAKSSKNNESRDRLLGSAGGQGQGGLPAIGLANSLGLLPKELGRPPDSTKNDKFDNRQSLNTQSHPYSSFGKAKERPGVRAGQKSLKEQRDLAQLRFY